MAFLLGAGLASAQSLGELARRDRERRAAVKNHARVLTNEDFRRSRILEPAPAAPPPSVSLGNVMEQPGFSLGEYARELRRQRAALEAPQAAAQEPAVASSSVRTIQPAPAGISLGD